MYRFFFLLKFIGVKDMHTWVVEGTTWPGKEKREEGIAHGKDVARKLAAEYSKR